MLEEQLEELEVLSCIQNLRVQQSALLYMFVVFLFLFLMVTDLYVNMYMLMRLRTLMFDHLVWLLKRLKAAYGCASGACGCAIGAAIGGC